MNGKGYCSLFFKSMKSFPSVVLEITGFVLTFVLWMWKPEQDIHLFWFIPLVFLFLVFINFSRILYVNRKQKCVVLHVIEPYGNFKSNDKVLALATYVDYFTENGVVSIFHLENGFERQIALGQIINIQEDKKVQILIFNIDSAFPCDELLKNNKELLERLLVKPIVKLDYLEEIKYGK